MERTGYIGGSDWEDILADVLPKEQDEVVYGCRRRLCYEKRGTPPDYPEEITAPMRRGIRLEHVAAEYFTEKTGHKVRAVKKLKTSVALPAWWGGHPDRMIVAEKGASLGPGILELKCVGERSFKQVKRYGVRQRQFAQLQHYLAPGFKWGILAYYWPDGDDMFTSSALRDDDLIKLMVDVGDIFWRSVTEGPLPDRLDPTDKRCRRCAFRHSCQGAAAFAEMPEDDGEIVRLDDESIVKLLREERDLALLVEETQAAHETVKEKLKLRIGNTQAFEVPGFRVYYRATKQLKFDSTAFRREHPDMYESYKREHAFRALRIFEI